MVGTGAADRSSFDGIPENITPRNGFTESPLSGFEANFEGTLALTNLIDIVNYS